MLLESFRPGVLDRLGVGYERLRQENPRLVYCAITGYGQDGPNRDRSGHDMNYLGLAGLLGLTGEADGPPVQAAGQIADLGGGALMGAVGILVALRERERSGEGQFVDCSMFDGALSWLAMRRRRGARRRADAAARQADALAGSLICYRPVPLRRWVRQSLGRAGAEVLGGVVSGRRPRGPQRPRVRPARLGCPRRGERDLRRAHAGGVASVRLGVRLLPGAGARARRGRSTPSSSRPGRWSIELDQPGAEKPVRLLGAPIKLDRTPADPARAPGPGLGEHTEEVLADAGLSAGADRRADLRQARRRAGRRPCSGRLPG